MERQHTDDADGDRDKVIVVDSRARAEMFRNVILKINRDEADAACQRIGGDYRALREHTRSKLLVITHGADGALVISKNPNDDPGDTWVGARPIQNPVDLCGAGDSFSAGAAVALAVTGSPLEAAQFGNLVASVTITKKGTGTASPQELLELASFP
jgi:sugar/nucleoside kinase (ribokinase family)